MNCLKYFLLLTILCLGNRVQAQTTLISPIGDGGFELGATPQANGWLTANQSVDKWGVGNLAAVAPPSGNAAYISADGGVSWAYSQNDAVSHLYKNVVVAAGTNRLRLSFKWKVGGDGATTLDYDNMKVFFIPDSLTPTANITLPSGYQILTNARTLLVNNNLGMYKLSAANFTEDSLSFTVPAGNYKLVFQWKTNVSVIAQPPAAIDEVSLTATPSRTIVSAPMGGLWNSPATWVGGVVPIGDDVLIAAGTNVAINDRINVRHLTVAGRLQVGAANFTGIVRGDVLVENTGSFNGFLPNGMGSGIGMLFYVAGHFTNNGTANFTVSTLLLNGSQIVGGRMVQNLTGTGTFIGNDTCGILRSLSVQTAGAVHINTRQRLNIINSLVHTGPNSTIHTNGKLILNNGTTSIGLPMHQQVTEIVMTDMGAGYTSAPTVTLSAPTGNGRTATAIADFDASTGTIRQIRITDAGTGYRFPPTVTLTGGGGFSTMATAVANHVPFIGGTAVTTLLKSGGTNFTGGLEIASGQGVTGVFWDQTATNNVGYRTAPMVGFTPPSGFLNLVTNGGSGYTVAPTASLTGGTIEVAGTAPAFQVNIAQGRVVSVIMTSSGTTCYSTLPQIQLTGGDGTGAMAAFPVGCLATATAILDVDNQMIKNIVVTNPGFGYSLAPTVGFSTVGNVATAPITVWFVRTAAYNLTLSQYLPSTVYVPHVEDAAIPTHRRISALTMNTTSTIQLNQDIELYGSAPLNLASGILTIDNGNGTMRFTNYNYGGSAVSNENNYVNAKILLSTPGGTTSATRYFPFDAPVTMMTGTDYTATSILISQTTAPSGTAVAPATGVATGNRGYRMITNVGSRLGTGAVAILSFNSKDVLNADNGTLFFGQSTSLTGPWAVRTSAAAPGTLITPGTRIATTAITTTGNDYFSWVTNLDYNASVASGNWNAPTTWSRGVVPVCGDPVYIQANHQVTVNSAGNVSKNLTINPLGTLTVASGDVTVGCTGFNNPLAIKGTLNVTGGTVNLNGNIDAILGSTFTQSGGAINVDGNDGVFVTTSVNANVPLVKIVAAGLNSVNWTGGTLTIIDPHASPTPTQSLLLIGDVAGGANVTSGHTLRLGNGVSTHPGGNGNSGYGFYLTTWVGGTGLPLGNLVLAGAPSGQGRFVFGSTALVILGDLLLQAGGDMQAPLLVLNGNLTLQPNSRLVCSNTLYLTNAAYTSNNTIDFTPSTNLQTIVNNGILQNAYASPTAALTGLTVYNRHATGVVLNSPLTVGNLNLMLGKVNTTATNLLTLTLTSAEGNLTGGSDSAYVNGPMARLYGSRASGAAADLQSFFPIGKNGKYLPLHLMPTTTGFGLQLKAEAFTTNTGTFSNAFSSLSSNRWEVSKFANSALMTQIAFRQNDTAIVNGKVILQATSGNGAYGDISVGSTFSTGALTTAAVMPTANFTGFLSYGARCQMPLPTATAQSLCSGKTVADLVATGVQGATLSWYSVSSGGAALSSSTVLTSGTYYVEQTLGCPSARQSVVVTLNPTPSVLVRLLDSATFCDGRNATLAASSDAGLFIYEWRKYNDVIVTQTGEISNLIVHQTGVYTVKVTNSYGCSVTSAGTSITVNPKPIPTILGNTTFCQNDSSQLRATGGGISGTYQWSNGLVDSSIWVRNAATYTVTVTNRFGCSATTSQLTTVRTLPTATITPNSTATICEGNPIALNANTGNGLTYQWRRNGTAIVGATNASYNAGIAGNYTVVVQDAFSCMNTSLATNLLVNPRPSVNFSYLLQAGTGSVTNFTNSSTGGSTLIWSFGDSLKTTSTDANPTFWYKKNGSYTVQLKVTGANGCMDSLSQTVVITGVRTGVQDLSKPLIINAFPNPFTEILTIKVENAPNALGDNDRILVTNALGQRIYQSVLNSKRIELDTHDWTEGIYHLTIYSNGAMIAVQKVVKVNQ